MSDFAPTPAAPAGDPQAYIADLINRASDTSLPISGRNKIVAQIDAYHRNGGIPPMGQTPVDRPQGYTSAPPAQPDTPDETQRGQDAPVEAGIESMVHDGVTVENVDGFRTMQAAMRGAEIPDAYAGCAVAEISRLHAQGASVSGEAHDRALQSCRAAIEKSHGPDAKALLADGMAFLNDLAQRQPSLADAIEEAAASPILIQQAAMMHRRKK